MIASFDNLYFTFGNDAEELKGEFTEFSTLRSKGESLCSYFDALCENIFYFAIRWRLSVHRCLTAPRNVDDVVGKLCKQQTSNQTTDLHFITRRLA